MLAGHGKRIDVHRRGVAAHLGLFLGQDNALRGDTGRVASTLPGQARCLARRGLVHLARRGHAPGAAAEHAHAQAAAVLAVRCGHALAVRPAGARDHALARVLGHAHVRMLDLVPRGERVQRGLRRAHESLVGHVSGMSGDISRVCEERLRPA
jgi:hypothetical protein